MDKFICPHCGKELDLGTIFEDCPIFYLSYCKECDRVYYLNGQKELYLEGIAGIRED